MEQTTPEQPIYLKPLLQTFFHQWKMLLVFMLAGTLLLGAYQAFMPKSSPALDTDAIAALEAQIDDYQQSLQSNSQRRADNLEAIGKKQDAIREFRADITQEEEYLSLCRDTLRQVEDLLEAAVGDAKISLLAQYTTLNDDIRGAQEALEQLENAITANQEEIQRLREDNLETIPESNISLMEGLADLRTQKEALEAAAEPTDVSPSPKKILVFALVGLVLGACLRAVWVFLQAIASHKLQDVDAIVSGYGIPLLASVKGAADAGAAYRLAAAKLQVQLPEGQEILVTGTLPGTELETVCEGLRKYSSHPVHAAGNAALDANATLALDHANVVIVESSGLSDFRQITDMMQALSLCGAKCLGLVEK